MGEADSSDCRFAELERRQRPLERISDDAKSFIRNWGDIGELLDAATDEERLQLIRHYVEVVELHATDAKGRAGTYAMRLFPEVRPDRGLDWGTDWPEEGPDDGKPSPETTNGDDIPKDAVPAVLTDSRLVCISDEKAPRFGLERCTHQLTEPRDLAICINRCGFVKTGEPASQRLPPL